jgi:hypothetical protein
MTGAPTAARGATERTRGAIPRVRATRGGEATRTATGVGGGRGVCATTTGAGGGATGAGGGATAAGGGATGAAS